MNGEEQRLAPAFSTAIMDDGVDLEQVDLGEPDVHDNRADISHAQAVTIDTVDSWRLDQQVRRVHRYLDAMRGEAIRSSQLTEVLQHPSWQLTEAETTVREMPVGGAPSSSGGTSSRSRSSWSLAVACGVGFGLAISLVGAALVVGPSLQAYQVVDDLGLWLLIGGQTVLAVGLLCALLRGERSVSTLAAAGCRSAGDSVQEVRLVEPLANPVSRPLRGWTG